LRNVNFEVAVAAVNAFAFMSVAGITIIGACRFAVPEVFIHLRLHHLFDGTSKQVFQGVLNVIGVFDVILLEELPDDGSLPVSHLNFVNLFPLFCHSRRPPIIRFYHRRPCDFEKKFVYREIFIDP